MNNRQKIETFLKWFELLPPDEAKQVILEHLGESNHQGWDGFSPRDLSGIARLLEDMKLYWENKV